MTPPTHPNRQALTLKAWVILSRAHSAVGARAAADVAQHGLTLAEFGILEALLHKGPLLLSELKRKILVSAGGITYLVDRLESRGLVERQPCEHDRRASYAALTPAGQELIGGIFPGHASTLEQAFGALSDEELARLIEVGRKLGTSASGG